MWMTDSEIRTSYRQALNPEEQINILAELNDCSKSRIEYILGLSDELGPEIRLQRSGLYSPEVRKAVLEYVGSGKTVLQAERYFGLRHETIYQWCRKAGIHARRTVPPQAGIHARRTVPPQAAWIIADLESGMRVKDVADKYGKSEMTIRRYREKYRERG